MPRARRRDTSDPAQVGAQERTARERRRTEVGDLVQVLRTKEGRRLIWRILGECKVSQTVIDNPVTPNASLMFINAGMQNVGIWLQSQIADADQGAMLKMMQENFDAAERAAQTELAARVSSSQEDN